MIPQQLIEFFPIIPTVIILGTLMVLVNGGGEISKRFNKWMSNNLWIAMPGLAVSILIWPIIFWS